MTLKNGLNANAEEVVKSLGTITAQNTNRILKSDTSVFVNEQYSGADDFTDSNGVMNTLDITNSTAFYGDTTNVTPASEDFYQLDLDSDTIAGTTHDPDSMTDPANLFDGNLATFSSKAGGDGQVALGKTFSARTVNFVRVKAVIKARTTSGTGSGHVDLYIESFNGSTWDVIQKFTGPTQFPVQSQFVTATVNQIVSVDSSVQGIRVRADMLAPGTDDYDVKFYYLAEGDYNISDTVESNSIISDIVPKSIVVYGDKELPANTSITVDVSDDGGSTFSITGESLDSYIDTTSFSGSDLALKFNLATSDTSVTPKLFGYGLAITDS